MAKTEYPCDACAYKDPINNICPGLDAHCKVGDHCISWEASCAMEHGMSFLGEHGDHGSKCCHCGEELKSNGYSESL